MEVLLSTKKAGWRDAAFSGCLTPLGAYFTTAARTTRCQVRRGLDGNVWTSENSFIGVTAANVYCMVLPANAEALGRRCVFLRVIFAVLMWGSFGKVIRIWTYNYIKLVLLLLCWSCPLTAWESTGEITMKPSSFWANSGRSWLGLCLLGNVQLFLIQYWWWKRSGTTWDVWNIVNNDMFTISTGAGFLPPTISQGGWLLKYLGLYLVLIKFSKWVESRKVDKFHLMVNRWFGLVVLDSWDALLKGLVTLGVFRVESQTTDPGLNLYYQSSPPNCRKIYQSQGTNISPW